MPALNVAAAADKHYSLGIVSTHAMPASSPVRQFLKWASISWTVLAVAVIALSHIMIVQNWSPVTGLEPFDVKDSLKVFLLLAPGALGAAIDLFLAKRFSKLPSCSGEKSGE